MEPAWPYQDSHGQAISRNSSTTEMTPEQLSSVSVSQYWCYQTLPELSRFFIRPALLSLLLSDHTLTAGIPAPGQKMWTSSFTPQHYLLRSQTASASRVLQFVRWMVHSECILHVAADTDIWVKLAMAPYHVQFYLCPFWARCPYLISVLPQKH